MLKKKSSQPQHLATGAEEVILKDALTRSAVKVQQNWTKQDGKITISFQRKSNNFSETYLAFKKSLIKMRCCGSRTRNEEHSTAVYKTYSRTRAPE